MNRVLGCAVVALVVGVGAVACGNDDDGGDGGSETRSTEEFCVEFIEFSTQVAASRNLTTQQAVEEYAEEVATQARELADVAPAEVADDTNALASGAEDAADAIADNDPERASEVNEQINQQVQALTSFAEQNCPGGSVPTSPPG